MTMTSLLVRLAVTLGVVGTGSPALAAPYTFLPSDYLEYGIYFAEPGVTHGSKLLTLRYGDIDRYYATFYPDIRDIPSPCQRLFLRTDRGSVAVDREDNLGLQVMRDTFNSKKRTGTKRLSVRFRKGVCRDERGKRSRCAVKLLLTSDGPDEGVIREPRTLRISTSTGLRFRYRSIRTDGSRPLDRDALRRSATITNYAWEWRS